MSKRMPLRCCGWCCRSRWVLCCCPRCGANRYLHRWLCLCSRCCRCRCSSPVAPPQFQAGIPLMHRRRWGRRRLCASVCWSASHRGWARLQASWLCERGSGAPSRQIRHTPRHYWAALCRLPQCTACHRPSKHARRLLSRWHTYCSASRCLPRWVSCGRSSRPIWYRQPRRYPAPHSRCCCGRYPQHRQTRRSGWCSCSGSRCWGGLLFCYRCCSTSVSYRCRCCLCSLR